MDGPKPILSLVKAGSHLSCSGELMSPYLYHSLVDALLYATMTHSYFSYAINRVYQYMN